MPKPPPTFDLRQRRKQRVEQREGGAEAPVLVFGDVTVLLPVELPLQVLAPVVDLDLDLAMLIRKAVDAARGSGDERSTSLDFILDLLVANPNLPAQAVAAVKDVARNLFGDDGYEALVAERPSLPDIQDLVKFIVATYGVGLGESSSPDEQSGSGTESSASSNASTDSTPAPSTRPRKRKASSAPAAS
jgi:hypothetical protein